MTVLLNRTGRMYGYSAGGTDVQYLGTEIVAGSSGTAGTYTFASKTLGTGTIYVGYLVSDTGTNTGTGISVDGVTATLVTGTASQSGFRTRHIFYSAACTSATGDIIATIDSNVSRAIGISWWLDPAGRSVVDTSVVDNAANVSSISGLDVDVVSDDTVLIGCGGYKTTTSALTGSLTGATEETGSDATVAEGTNDKSLILAGRHVATGSETPRTLSASFSETLERVAGSALVLR